MSKVGQNPIMATVSGKLSNIVVYRRVRGQLIMCKPPRKRDVLTPQQESAKERFIEAVQYAKAMAADPVHKAEYQTGITPRLTSAYAVALTDYLKAPEVKEIDISGYHGVVGDLLKINAKDDFKVVSVSVEIYNASHALIERGAATRTNAPKMWSYVTTVANATRIGTRIVVKAEDKPGNITVAEKVIA